MTVLEVGANIGVFTVPLARFVHPGGRVIAFEPQRIMYQMLCGNLALNADDNVVAHNSAAGRSSGSVAVPSVDYGKPGNFGAVSLARSRQGEIVPLVTIDSLALPSCHLIKVDVEGMELDVLEGASSTLRQFRPLLYGENDQPEKSPPLIAYLLALDYRLYWLEPPLYRSDNFFWRRGEYLRERRVRRYGLRPAQRTSGDHRQELRRNHFARCKTSGRLLARAHELIG
jgi:FkbM family methyltransferase